MKLLGWYKWCFVVTIWCTIIPSRALLDAKRDFGRSFTNGTLNLSFCMNILKISNQFGRASRKHHFACDCAPLYQIVCHLNNARWINGPQVANWGRGTRSTNYLVRPQLFESGLIGVERLFIQIYYFPWTVVDTQKL